MARYKDFVEAEAEREDTAWEVAAKSAGLNCDICGQSLSKEEKDNGQHIYCEEKFDRF